MKYTEKDKNCKDCRYDDRGRLETLCGPCEEEGIRQRINWWQEGKRKLNDKLHTETMG